MQNINYSTLKEKDSNKTTKVRDCPPRDKQKKPRGFDPALSHIAAVPSARKGLTSLFGMDRGGSPSL